MGTDVVLPGPRNWCLAPDINTMDSEKQQGVSGKRRRDGELGCRQMLVIDCAGYAVLGIGTGVLRSDVVVEAQLAYVCNCCYVEACSEKKEKKRQAMQKAYAMARNKQD